MTTVTQGKFEWDDEKEKINIQKHGLSFSEILPEYFVRASNILSPKISCVKPQVLNLALHLNPSPLSCHSDNHNTLLHRS